VNIFIKAKRTKNYKYTLLPEHLVQLESFFSQLMKEKQSQHEDRENGILLWLHPILLTIHRVIPKKKNLILSTAIFFNPSYIRQTSIGDSFQYVNIFIKAKRTKNYKYTLLPEHLVQLESFFSQLMEEKQSQHEDRENGILLWLHLILLTIHRNLNQKKTHQHEQSMDEPDWIKQTLTLINQHISDDLDLQYIAETVSVSEAHLSRVFKQLVGMTVSNYIMVKRIHLAKDLLVNSNMKIATIAEQCGFNSLPHFYRTFKKQTSLTPTEYRKKTLS